MLYSVPTKKSLNEIEVALWDAAGRHKFGVLTMHDLQATLHQKGVEFGKICRIYEICNPQKAKAALEANGAISTALPCRVSVFEEEGGGLRIATLLPTELLKSFGSEKLTAVAEEVEETVKKIIDETA